MDFGILIFTKPERAITDAKFAGGARLQPHMVP